MSIARLQRSIAALFAKGGESFALSYQSGEGTIDINAEQPFPAASVIKLFILIEVYRRLEKGELKRDDMITIHDASRVGGAGVLRGFASPTYLPLIDLMNLMIVVSDNTASNILLSKVGFESVRGAITALGANHTRIERHFFDLQAIKEGRDNITTASDAVKALKCIAEPNEFLNEASRLEMRGMLSRQQFRAKLPAYFPDGGPVQILNKTGELPGMEHDVAIIETEGRLDYLAVFTNGWRENADGQRRVADIGRLVHDYSKE